MHRRKVSHFVPVHFMISHCTQIDTNSTCHMAVVSVTPIAKRYTDNVIRFSAWATRTLIVRQLKGLDDIIPTTVVSPRMDEHGWPFANIDPFPGAEKDPLYGADHLKDVYLRVSPDYKGRFTVPLLFDNKTQSIVNNESSDIIRIFNSAFNHLLPPEKARLDLYPEPLRSEIDELNAWVYDTVNSMTTLTLSHLS